MAETDNDLEKAQFLKQFEAGRYLKSIRANRPLSAVCKELGVSTAYVSQVEQGKMPSDHFLSVVARVYEIDEDDLFFRWGKIPILAQQVVKENKRLLDTLTEIGRNKKLTDEQKDRLYDSMYNAYNDFIEEIKSEG